MGAFKLQRRTILKGIGGAILGLPALEIMHPGRARAAAPPRRFVVIYGGSSLGADGSPALVTPDNPGLDYDLKRALLPLGAGALPANPGLGGEGYDVQQHASVVSGLKIPWDTGGGVPAGGRSPEFHYNTFGQQLSGMRGPQGAQEEPNGPTVDQIVAEAIAGDTPYPYLSYRVQAASYVGNNAQGGSDARISYRAGDGGLEAIDPVFSPQLAYSTLFGSFIPPDPTEAAAAERFLRRHKSVIDLVRQRTERLTGKLGGEDLARMERHLDEIRDLEARLAAIPSVGGSCSQPPDPGDDPPVAGAAVEYNGEGGGGSGYSNEELRASTLFDLIAMAFACDLTRVAAVRMTFTQSFLQMMELIGVGDNLHQIGHNGDQQGFSDCVGWHVKHFARFLAKLRDTPEVGGGSLLDHTAVVLLFEGGLGTDAENPSYSYSPHSSENMVALVGGHAGGLNPGGGKHIVANNAAHPAQALISAMKAVGVAEDTETLGEVSGAIPELFA
jgi:hypothetical protein